MRQVADAVCTVTVYGLIILILGCAGPSSRDLQPFIAVTGNYSVEAGRHPSPPEPKPQDDKCETCRGTGKADGRVVCPVCNGTGKKVTAKPSTKPCDTGTCSTQRIVR